MASWLLRLFTIAGCGDYMRDVVYGGLALVQEQQHMILSELYTTISSCQEWMVDKTGSFE